MSNRLDELQAHYDRNADAGGHAAECRRRVIPQLGSDSKALDPERCEPCVILTAQLDDAKARREARHGR